MLFEPRLMMDLGMVLLAGLVGGAIFQRLRLPPVVGMILAGLALNRFTPGYVVQSNEIQMFGQLGALLMMFVLGLQFEYRHFRRLGIGAFTLAAVGALATYLCGVTIALWLGWTSVQALLLGALFVSTSTTIALKLFEELKIRPSEGAQAMKAAIVIDDLFGFVALALVAFGTSSSASASFGLSVLIDSMVMILAMMAIFWVGVRVMPKVSDWMENLVHGGALTFGAAFCLVLSYFGLMFNISPIVGAFLAGTILTSTFGHKDVLKAILPVRHIFAGIFFTSIGLLIDPGVVLLILPLALGLTTAAVVSKWLASSAFLIMRYGEPLRHALEIGALTAPRGEVLLIIAQTAVLAGTAPSIFLAIAMSIVLISALAVPGLLFLIRSRPNACLPSKRNWR